MPWPATIRASSNGGMIVEPTLGRDPLGDDPALVRGGPDDDDLGAIRLHARELDRGRIGRHDDDRRDTEQPGGARDPLRVVPRGIGDQAPGACDRIERRGRVVRAADLERPDRLEALGLEPLAAVGPAEGHERRADGDAAQPRRGIADRRELDEGGAGTLLGHRSFAAR